MAWDAPDQCWRFAIGDDPPADMPDAWAAAAGAVARDLRCRRHGRTITFANVGWRFAVSDEWMAVGFDALGEADVSTYQRCHGYRWEASESQASVWLADDVQYELAGYEFVQWPIAGQRILQPRLLNDDAMWLQPGTNTVTAPIGELCATPDHF